MTAAVKKLTLEIYQDDGDNPREWDNLCTMAYKHRRYMLGDEEITDPIDWLISKMSISRRSVEKLEAAKKYGFYSNEVREYLEHMFFNHDKFVAKPLYLYDHSGITIATTPFGCRWDSGQVGYIYCSLKQAQENWGRKRGGFNAKHEDWFNKGKKVTLREMTKRVMDGELETFDQYIRGDVYGFRVVDQDGEVVDSCGGFFGTNWMENGMADHVQEEVMEQLKNFDKDKIEY
jgi:hypothetical protein